MFPQGHSFGMVALDGLAVDAGVPSELHLDPTRSVVRGVPFDLEGGWRMRLGEVVARRLERSALTFIAVEPDLGPGRRIAVREAEGLFRCLQLVGFVRLESQPLWIGGRTATDEGPLPEAVGELRRPRVPPGALTPPLGWVEIGYALRLREGLRRAEEEARGSLVHRALAAFTSGTHRPSASERIHEFVRALEALVAPVDGGGLRRAFRKRTRLFLEGSEPGLMDRLYRVKRRAGHARAAADLYADAADEFSRRVELWHDAVTAEVLVRTVLQRLLLSPAMWEHFRDEESADRFWSSALTAEDRYRMWGQAIDVAGARAAFRRGALHPSDPGL